MIPLNGVARIIVLTARAARLAAMPIHEEGELVAILSDGDGKSMSLSFKSTASLVLFIQEVGALAAPIGLRVAPGENRLALATALAAPVPAMQSYSLH